MLTRKGSPRIQRSTTYNLRLHTVSYLVTIPYKFGKLKTAIYVIGVTKLIQSNTILSNAKTHMNFGK
jgi:hypothetical protein